MVSALWQQCHTWRGIFFLVPQFQDQNLIHSVVHGNAMKAYRGRRGIAQLILNLSTKLGWMVNLMPLPLYPQERTLVPIEKEAVWAPLPVSTFWNREYWAYGILKSSELVAIPAFIQRCPVWISACDWLPHVRYCFPQSFQVNTGIVCTLKCFLLSSNLTLLSE